MNTQSTQKDVGTNNLNFNVKGTECMRTDLTPSEAAVLNQGIPEKGTGPAIINLVLDDLKELDWEDTIKTSFIKRAAKGEMFYGYPLQANNGRDALSDAYQEAIDLCLYLKQVSEEGSTVADLYVIALMITADLHDMILERGEEK